MTNKETALVPVTTNAVMPGRMLDNAIVDLIIKLAPYMRHTSKRSISTEQMAAMMMMAYEYGFNPTSANNIIHWIDGPSLSAEAMHALLIASKRVKTTVNMSYDDKGEPTCTVTMSRTDQPLTFTTTFSMDMARKAKLMRPDSGWDKYPHRMVMWRAISDCASVVAPDITSGLHLQFDIIDEPPPMVNPTTGEIIEEGEFTVDLTNDANNA